MKTYDTVISLIITIRNNLMLTIKKCVENFLTDVLTMYKKCTSMILFLNEITF